MLFIVAFQNHIKYNIAQQMNDLDHDMSWHINKVKSAC